MNTEETKKVKNLLETIKNAAVVIVDNSPYLHSVCPEEFIGDPENEVLLINWHDDEGLEYKAIFTEKNLSEAKIFGNQIFLKDKEEYDCEIRLFNLEPVFINLDKH